MRLFPSPDSANAPAADLAAPAADLAAPAADLAAPAAASSLSAILPQAVQEKIAKVPRFVWIIMGILCGLALAGLLLFWIYPGGDWECCMRPAGITALAGKNPYILNKFYNPPWALAIIAPFAALPEPWGGKLFTLLQLTATITAVIRFKPKLSGALLFFLCPTVIAGLLLGNLDGLVVLGMTLPPPIGLLLVMLKPQIGAFVALYWLIMAWRAGGYKEVIRQFAPLAAVGLASLAFYGLFFARYNQLTTVGHNGSLFPYSIPLGVLLFWLANRSKRLDWAVLGGACLTPYLNVIDGLPFAFPLVRSPRLAVVVLILNWAWIGWLTWRKAHGM